MTAPRRFRLRALLRKFGGMLVCCVAASGALADHALAGQIFQERYHDEGTFVHQNYCGITGLTVRDTAVIGMERSAR